jgi:hypothetical protein
MVSLWMHSSCLPSMLAWSAQRVPQNPWCLQWEAHSSNCLYFGGCSVYLLVGWLITVIRWQYSTFVQTSWSLLEAVGNSKWPASDHIKCPIQGERQSLLHILTKTRDSSAMASTEFDMKTLSSALLGQRSKPQPHILVEHSSWSCHLLSSDSIDLWASPIILGKYKTQTITLAREYILWPGLVR